MPQRYKQLSQLAGDNTRNTVPSISHPFDWTCVPNHEGHELLTLKWIIILNLNLRHAFCGFAKFTMCNTKRKREQIWYQISKCCSVSCFQDH